jgi:hypothetical protein
MDRSDLMRYQLLLYNAVPNRMMYSGDPPGIAYSESEPAPGLIRLVEVHSFAAGRLLLRITLI